MWGEHAVGGFFEDMHVLIVVVLGMSILLGSLAAAYVSYESGKAAAALRTEAQRALRAVLEDDRLLHDSVASLLDFSALDGLNASVLRQVAGTNRPVQLVISEQSGEGRRTFTAETGPLGATRASASTAASVWHSDLDVRAARVTATVGA